MREDLNENFSGAGQNQPDIPNSFTVETEEIRQRTLPWFIDIFLYPASAAGIVNLGIFWFAPYLIRLVVRITPPLYVLPSLVSAWLQGFVGAYMLYYFAECIRNSSVGGIRAPETPDVSFDDVSELLTQLLYILACIAICFGPAGAYFLITKRTDSPLWIMLGCGVFFFPMVLLAVIMFDSLWGLNPVLLIRSIFSTFFRYCGLVACVCGLGAMIAIIMRISPQSRTLAFLLQAVFIYLAMVMVHSLGRFYYRNQEKLNWEV